MRNVEKTKYSFSHKPSKKDDMPFCLPKLIIINYEIQGRKMYQVPWGFTRTQLAWKEHINLTENKAAKNIDTLHKARPYLDRRVLLYLFYPYIHSYQNYANTGWSSTNGTYLLELSFRKRNLHIHKNISKKIIY